MSKIKAFRALRPTRDKVHLVATKPYYTYKRNVLNAKLESNPFTFLHIINPEFRLKRKKVVSTQEDRFNMVKDAYVDFIKNDILIQDEEEHIYIYRQTKNGFQYTGIVAGASVQEYDNNEIKKHEATLTSREKMFTEYLDVVGYNAEPVLLTYQDSNTHIDSIIQRKVQERPEYEFTTTDRITHELWICNEIETEFLVEEFEKINASYIADGHHRSASSARLKHERANRKGSHSENEDYFLAFFMNEDKINIMEFNRIVRHLNNNTPEQFLDLLSTNFDITQDKKFSKPKHEHEISMFLDNKWFRLCCKSKIIDKDHPVNSLIPEILTQYILDPILGIKDLKSDENISFLSGDIPISKMSQLIKKGEYKVGFVLHPLSIDDVKNVADHNMIMPPKSTYIEPKLRSGLTIYQIDE